MMADADVGVAECSVSVTFSVVVVRFVEAAVGVVVAWATVAEGGVGVMARFGLLRLGIRAHTTTHWIHPSTHNRVLDPRRIYS